MALATLILLGGTAACGGGGGSSGSTGSTSTTGQTDTGVHGRLYNINDTGIVGATIRIYNSSGVEIDDIVTGTNGWFGKVVPSNAVKFTIDIEAVDPPNSSGKTIYYRQFTYNSKDYLMGQAACLAPLPTIASNGKADLGQIFIPAKAGGTIPPPPTGCI